MPALFNKRQIWLPTLWGALLIITIVMSLLVGLWTHIAVYLAKTEPVPSPYLVVEGWLSEPALLQAVKEYKSAGYEFIITTGGPDTRQIKPLYDNFADKSAAFIRSFDLDSDKVISIPTPASAQDRTYLSAVMVRHWFESQGITPSITVFSADVHARRTHYLYKKAFANSTIGIIAAQATEFELQHWWQSSSGAKSVLTETAALLWLWCCFSPGEKDSHQEKWGSY